MTAQRIRSPQGGFTLLELVVILLILVTVLGLARLNLTSDDRALARDAASRLLLLLQGAQEDAVLRGRPYVVELRQDGYRFMLLENDGKLVAFDTGPYRPQRLTRARLHAEGAQIDEDGVARFLIEPTGELNPFEISVTVGAETWYVRGHADGTLRTQTTPG